MRFSSIGTLGAALVAGLWIAGDAGADTESCREWRGEHRGGEIEVVRRYLRGAPQPAVDAAVFELLQREAWLTSCDVPVRVGREELVGWRLPGRVPDEYAAAVVSSVLERAGYDVSLRETFAQSEPSPARMAASDRRFRRARSR